VLTPSVYWIFICFQFREKVYEIYEEICGACLTTNMGSGFEEIGLQSIWIIKHFFRRISSSLKEFENLFERNRIFIDRTVNVTITAEQAMAYGFTGPKLQVLIMMCVAYRILLTKILILLFLLKSEIRTIVLCS
jgi:NADH:ubiquinone oxidoreductase subunit D